MAQTGSGNSDSGARGLIALTVVGLSIAAIGVAAGLAIGYATTANRPEMTRLVFTSVLPLFGTWVGTVLAFYFARENLQTATESVQSAAETTLRLTGRFQSATPVQEAMIPASRITAYRLGANEDPLQIKLGELLSRMQAAGVHRIPIVDASGAVRYVMHDSTISAFASKSGQNPADLSFTQTLGDVLQDPEFRTPVQAIGFVGPNAVLGDARAAMRSIDRCNDVFVTTDGKATGQMLGWLTNTDLAGLAE